ASSSARHHLVNEVSATSSARPPYRGGRAADEGPRADVIPTADERDVTDLLPPARVWLDPSGDLIDTHTGEVLNTTGGAQRSPHGSPAATATPSATPAFTPAPAAKSPSCPASTTTTPPAPPTPTPPP